MNSRYKEINIDDPSMVPLELEALRDDGSISYRKRGLGWNRIYAVTLYAITAVLLYADQNLLAPNLTQIANEFGFSEEERDRKLGGDISLAFFLLGAPASIIIGCWADQADRILLLGGTVGIGEGACFATYFCQTYRYLYICRAITGLSLGGALPLMYSVLADWFRAEDRHAVSAVVGVGTGAGIALGQGISGFLGPAFGWRLPFLVVSVPALMCALLLVFTVKDPERGAMEKVILERKRLNSVCEDSWTGSVSSVLVGESDCVEAYIDTDKKTATFCGQDWVAHGKALKELISTPTFILTLLQGAPGCVPWGIVNTFLNDFLSEDRGMTVQGATMTVLLFGFGNLFGMLTGGGGGRYLYGRNPRYPPVFAGGMAILGCFPFWLLLNIVNVETNSFLVVIISVLAGLGSGVTGPIVKATLLNVTLPTARGQAFALFNTFDDFGRGLGPLFVSLLIARLGRTQAFNVGVLGWILCGVFNVCMYYFVDSDEVKVQAVLGAGSGILHRDNDLGVI